MDSLGVVCEMTMPCQSGTASAAAPRRPTTAGTWTSSFRLHNSNVPGNRVIGWAAAMPTKEGSQPSLPPKESHCLLSVVQARRRSRPWSLQSRTANPHGLGAVGLDDGQGVLRTLKAEAAHEHPLFLRPGAPPKQRMSVKFVRTTAPHSAAWPLARDLLPGSWRQMYNARFRSHSMQCRN